MLQLDAFRALMALTQHGSLTAAARYLDCPKSTLSRRIVQLEQALGCALTRQSGNRLTLTDAGQTYASYCQQMLDTAEQGRRAVAEVCEATMGELHVGISHELTHGWFTRVFNDFVCQNEGIRLRVHVAHANATADMKHMDVWLQYGDGILSGMHSHLLGRWKRRIYTAASADSPCRALADPANLLHCPWIGLVDDPAETELYADDGRRFSFHPIPRLQVGNLYLLADSILRGYGIGVLPSWLAECPRHGLQGHFSRVLGDWQALPVDIRYYLPAGVRARRTHLLIQHLRQSLPPRWAVAAAHTAG